MIMANMLMTMLQSNVLAQSHRVVESRYDGGWDELRKATGEYSGTGTNLAWDTTTVGYRSAVALVIRLGIGNQQVHVGKLEAFD